MFRPARLACALLALAPAAAAAPRAGHAIHAIEVRQAWSRPSAGGSGVGYMILVNRGTKADALVRVESPLAARVEAHRSDMAGGVMTMAPAARVEIPAGGEVTFAPGGYHLMFMGLKRPLKAGDRLPASLSFASGRRIAITFAVGTGAGPPPAGALGHAVAGPAAGAGRPQLVTKK